NANLQGVAIPPDGKQTRFERWPHAASVTAGPDSSGETSPEPVLTPGFRPVARPAGRAGLIEFRDIQFRPPLHESVRVVEVIRRRQQVRMRPDGVPAAHPARL